jgi:hypothetical protein
MKLASREERLNVESYIELHKEPLPVAYLPSNLAHVMNRREHWKGKALTKKFSNSGVQELLMCLKKKYLL